MEGTEGFVICKIGLWSGSMAAAASAAASEGLACLGSNREGNHTGKDWEGTKGLGRDERTGKGRKDWEALDAA